MTIWAVVDYGFSSNMGKVLFHWILVGIMIKMTGSIEISDSQSGSKSCNLTLRFNPSFVFFTGYQSLEIFKHANSRSDYSLLDCRVHSLEIRRGFHVKIPLKWKIFTRTVTKKHNANLEVCKLCLNKFIMTVNYNYERKLNDCWFKGETSSNSQHLQLYWFVFI